jgi:hypothetical protein
MIIASRDPVEDKYCVPGSTDPLDPGEGDDEAAALT